MKKTARIILKSLNTLIVAMIVLFAVLLVGVRAVGFKLFTVLSGSMEPAYPTGSLIYVKETDPSTLEAGDVITYHLSGNTTATHRIVEVLPDETGDGILRFRTKGDANEDVDPQPVSSDKLIGKPVFMIPYLGYVANYIQAPPGSYAMFGIGGALLLFVFVTDSLISGKEKSCKQEEDTEQREI